jgi:hypothetical protein
MSDAEHSLSAEDVCLDRMNRSLDNELYTDSRREMDDDVCFGGQPVEHQFVCYAGSRKVKVRMRKQMLYVLNSTGAEIVDHRHLVSH